VSHLPAATPPAVDLADVTVDLEHEWRTPMTVIQSAAEVLRSHRDLTDEEREQFLDALLAETARLRSSLEAVLTGRLVHAICG
jgi:signal transduction histidine kinase